MLNLLGVVLASLFLLPCCGGLPVKPENKGDPKERTMWELCVTPALDEDSFGLVDVNSDIPPHVLECTVPNTYMPKLKYRSLPIHVVVDNANGLYGLAVRQAVVQWNYWLGFDLLEYTSVEDFKASQGDSLILVGINTESDNSWFWGEALIFYDWTRNNFACAANIYKMNPESGRTLLHEIGHCLGLAHDGTEVLLEDYDVRNSIMKQGEKDYIYILTPADRYAIRRTYNQY